MMNVNSWLRRLAGFFCLTLLLVSLLLRPQGAKAATFGPIDHYLIFSGDSRSAYTIDSPSLAGTPFSVTIQAQDASNNNINSGADAQEVVTISSIKVDGGVSPTTVTTINGAATFNLTLTVAQNGQAVTVKGQHSGKTGISNSFDVVLKVNTEGSGTTVLSGGGTDLVDSYGKMIYPKTALSDDLLGSLNLPAGTTVLQSNGYRLSEVIMIESATPLTLPPNTSAVGLIYSFHPEGATFNPAVALVLGYKTALIPAGIAESRLYIAQGDRKTGAWSKLTGTVDSANHTITTQVSHFSDFAILAPTKSAAFNVSNVNVTPVEVRPSEKVTVTATVTNTGDLSGTYSATLLLDDARVASSNITLAGGASQQVSFSTSADAIGPHFVTVGGISGNFVVKAPATPTPSPTPSPSPTSKPTPTPTVTPTATPTPTFSVPVPTVTTTSTPAPTPTPTPTPSPTVPPSESGANAWIPLVLIAFVIIIGVVVGVVAWLVLHPRKKA